MSREPEIPADVVGRAEQTVVLHGSVRRAEEVPSRLRHEAQGVVHAVRLGEEIAEEAVHVRDLVRIRVPEPVAARLELHLILGHPGRRQGFGQRIAGMRRRGEGENGEGQRCDQATK